MQVVLPRQGTGAGGVDPCMMWLFSVSVVWVRMCGGAVFLEDCFPRSTPLWFLLVRGNYYGH